MYHNLEGHYGSQIGGQLSREVNAERGIDFAWGEEGAQEGIFLPLSTASSPTRFH